MNSAPIAIFVYKRPEHSKQMLSSLCKNVGYTNADITVYCDGPRDNDDLEDVLATRKIVREFLPEANIVEREENMGLARSIISGVSEQCKKYGRVIVLEDDLILSPVAINYFNQGLERYSESEKVMHISAYMFPVNQTLPSSFFYREATCWGWATWERAWQYFESDSEVILDYVLKNKLSYEFDIEDSMYFLSMLRRQLKGELDSWAIRWYGSMFMQSGLSLHPANSLMQNIGFDGSGVHCSSTNEYDVTLSKDMPDFPEDISECREAVSAMIQYRQKMQKPGVIGRLERVVVNLLNKFQFIK
jgi:hypothetical protein